MERREFIKAGCGLCASLATIGAVGSLLEGCKPGELIFNTTPTDGNISVPLEKFLHNKYVVVRLKHLEYDLLLVKENESTFNTLAMQCTHRQQPLVVTSTGLICNEHGSRFDLSGNVTRDPATKPLIKFKTELDGLNVVIHLS
ncbi:MAG: Rieske (2Fe-2S) protein [Bacteroidetes bacterium]|nr:Rieske (2Fe-2S) protein [Bacteroidota bacterium]